MIGVNAFGWGAGDMSTSGVNLDALIPREDFYVEVDRKKAVRYDETIGIHHLASSLYFVHNLRKPDFQRETSNWSPDKIVDLIVAFLDGDLVPAIILWNAGQYNFVIDGAHRLSALLAWIYDDYGDRSRSLNFFNHQIPEEQIRLANQTRDLVEKSIGPYQMYQDALKNVYNAPDHMKERLANLSNHALVAQWVPALDPAAAQNSFFKINEAPTPIDETEKRILRARNSASAIATRAISRGGTGHRYWSNFSSDIQKEIESLGKEINDALYLPSIGSGAVKSSDVPVGGRGYNALPFIFELVNQVNGVPANAFPAKPSSHSLNSSKIHEMARDDIDGSRTVRYMRTVRQKIRRITTTDPGSLGLHPLVYFYTRGGKFQPIAFLSILPVIDRLVDRGELDNFISVRRDFEDFIVNHKEAFTLIVKQKGAGARSRPALESFFEFVIEGLSGGKRENEILTDMAKDSRLNALAAPQPIRGGGASGKRDFSASVKTAAFVSELMRSGARCSICGTLVHRNSMHTDHIVRKVDGGGAHAGNAQIAHPYCNSTYKERRAANRPTINPPQTAPSPQSGASPDPEAAS